MQALFRTILFLSPSLYGHLGLDSKLVEETSEASQPIAEVVPHGVAEEQPACGKIQSDTNKVVSAQPSPNNGGSATYEASVPKTPEKPQANSDSSEPSSSEKVQDFRRGYGGLTQKAQVCKNDRCARPRTRDFRNALCPECEQGFRQPGRTRKSALWTEEMKKEVAQETRAKRARLMADPTQDTLALLEAMQSQLKQRIKEINDNQRA